MFVGPRNRRLQLCDSDELALTSLWSVRELAAHLLGVIELLWKVLVLRVGIADLNYGCHFLVPLPELTTW